MKASSSRMYWPKTSGAEDETGRREQPASPWSPRAGALVGGPLRAAPWLIRAVSTRPRIYRAWIACQRQQGAHKLRPGPRARPEPRLRPAATLISAGTRDDATSGIHPEADVTGAGPDGTRWFWRARGKSSLNDRHCSLGKSGLPARAGWGKVSDAAWLEPRAS